MNSDRKYKVPFDSNDVRQHSLKDRAEDRNMTRGQERFCVYLREQEAVEVKSNAEEQRKKNPSYFIFHFIRGHVTASRLGGIGTNTGS